MSTPFSLPPNTAAQFTKDGALICSGILITGPAGEMYLTNDQNGLWVRQIRKDWTIPSGYAFARLDDPGHYFSWSPDWATDGSWLALYDSLINQDIFKIGIAKAIAGKIFVGMNTGPRAVVNEREVTTELDQLKARIAALEKFLVFQKQQPQEPQ